jgi:hypothetical protein
MSVTVLPVRFFYIATQNLETEVSLETMNIPSAEMRLGIQIPSIRCLKTLF